MSRNPHPAMFAALIVCLAQCGHALPATDVQSPAWKAYQAELQRLWRARPRDELCRLALDGWLWRRMQLWVKVHPVVPSEGRLTRRVTVYLEDLAGNRINSVPDALVFEASGPAALDGASEQPLRNGEASIVLTVPTGAAEGSLLVTTAPVGSGEQLNLTIPFDSGPKQVVLLRSEGQPIPTRSAPVAESFSVAMRKTAADWLMKGRPLNAMHAVYSGGMALLEARRSDQALAYWQVGKRDFDSPSCAWGEVQLLRALGRAAEADAAARELVAKHPKSIPAQFAIPKAGEHWYVPQAALWIELSKR